jgi:hypothetical protein
VALLEIHNYLRRYLFKCQRTNPSVAIVFCFVLPHYDNFMDALAYHYEAIWCEVVHSYSIHEDFGNDCGVTCYLKLIRIIELITFAGCLILPLNFEDI